MAQVITGKPMLAAFIGVAATIPYELLERALQALGIAQYSAYQLSSLVITLNRPNAVVGFFASGVIGGAIALLLYRALPRLGTDYLIIKGIAAGIASWLVVEALFVWIIEGPGLIPTRPIADYLAHLAGAALYGGTTAALIGAYLLSPTRR